MPCFHGQTLHRQAPTSNVHSRSIGLRRFARAHDSPAPLPSAHHRSHQISLIDGVKGFGWTTLGQVAGLLSVSFYEDEDAWQRGTAGADEPGWGPALFGWASLLSVLLQHLTYGNRHVTLLARVDEQVVGCCGLSLEPVPPDVLAATGAAPGSQYGLLTGLAVAPSHRRRGVASELLEAAAAAAAARRPPPGMIALLVARTNIAALRLYERCGYEPATGWVDARWQAEAERGKVGKPRRLLLVRRLEAGEQAGATAGDIANR